MIERWRALAATPGTLLTAVATLGIGIGLNATLFAIMFPSAARTQKDLLRARKTSPISASDAYQIAQHSEWFRDAFAADGRWETRLGVETRCAAWWWRRIISRRLGVSSWPHAATGDMPEIVLSRRAALSLLSWPFAPVGRVVDRRGLQGSYRRNRARIIHGRRTRALRFLDPQSIRQAVLRRGTYRRHGRYRPPALWPRSACVGGRLHLSASPGFHAPFERAPGYLPSGARIYSVPHDSLYQCREPHAGAVRFETTRHRNPPGPRRVAKWQIAEIVMVDGIAIGILGAAVAFPVAWIGVRVADLLDVFSCHGTRRGGTQIEHPHHSASDPHSICGMSCLGVIAAVLFSVGPAWRASAQTVNESLRGEVAGVRIPRLLRTMALVQTSSARSSSRSQPRSCGTCTESPSVDPGYRSRGIAASRNFDPVAAKRSVEDQPWIASSALSTETLNISVNGHDAPITVISAGYFNTSGFPSARVVISTVDEANQSGGLAIVSAATARAWWPDGDAIGKVDRSRCLRPSLSRVAVRRIAQPR